MSKLAALILDDYHQRKKIINSVLVVSQNYDEVNASAIFGRQASLSSASLSASLGHDAPDDEYVLSDPTQAVATASSKGAVDNERLEAASTYCKMFC